MPDPTRQNHMMSPFDVRRIAERIGPGHCSWEEILNTETNYSRQTLWDWKQAIVADARSRFSYLADQDI